MAIQVDPTDRIGQRGRGPEQLAVGSCRQDEVGAARLPRRYDPLDGQRFGVQVAAVEVLEVAAGQTCLDGELERLRDHLRLLAVTVLEIPVDRYVARGGDLADALEHLVS
jgi:hypothetical protein